MKLSDIENIVPSEHKARFGGLKNYAYLCIVKQKQITTS
jgi:hypothetical protein